LDETAALDKDSRLRVVDYNPEQVVMVYTKVGQTTRIRLHPQERVVRGGVTHSDQFLMSSAEEAEEFVPCASNDAREECKSPASGATESLQSCNRNMCTSVVLNNVFIIPRTELAPQSFFLRTEWCPEAGRCLPGEYTIELRTLPPPVQVAQAGQAAPPIAQSFYGVQFRYAARERVYQSEVDREKRRVRAEAQQEFRRSNPQPLPPSVPEQTARYELGVCASGPEIQPDEAWTDGRTSFLRYKGGRRIPNVYERRAGDGQRTLVSYAVEPDAWGNTIRVAKVLPVLLLWDGDNASCVVNVAPDINGRSEMAVAPIRNPVAGRPRVRR
jgi:type IV secretory pathway VirB9-like protein